MRARQLTVVTECGEDALDPVARAVSKMRGKGHAIVHAYH